MLNILIGHRGTGKSHFLKLLQVAYGNKALVFDLDKEIEKSEGQSLSLLFQQSENKFRKIESQTFKKLISSIPKNKICFVAVGAGFIFKKDFSWNIIHLCRNSDESGRVFFNRPRLKPHKDPFKEYHFFYKKRVGYYFRQADEQWFRREHFPDLEDSDKLFLSLKKNIKPHFALRLDPQLCPKNKNQLRLFLQKRLNWGIRFFELNDQTANNEFVQAVRSFVPERKILFSAQVSKKFLYIKNKQNFSWDLSLGRPPKSAQFLSWHNRNKKSLKAILLEFSTYKNRHLKLAVEIFNLRELKMAYDWQKEDPRNRSFLPRSKKGRWLWFRQVFGPKMRLHFIRERACHFKKPEKGSKDILDQPFLSEALPYIKPWKALAGVLGDPVSLSATPAEQNHFFYEKRSVPVLSLPLKLKEMTKENLKILSDLHFIFFAVTSPLKKKAFLCVSATDKISQQVQSVNTLIWNQKKWLAFNTDFDGSKKLIPYSSNTTAVWGGGGLRPVLQKRLPFARFYSARTGRELPRPKPSKSFSPKTVIWAVGRGRMKKALMPPQHWMPTQVIDMNYTEDSPGRDYALKTGANYTNGWAFFKEQAKKQRDIFLRIERQKDILKR